MCKDTGNNQNSNRECAKSGNIVTLNKINKRLKYKGLSYKLGNLFYYQNPNSTLRKSYQNTIYCASALKYEDGKLTSNYCKNRWCLVCQRIKVGKLIKEKAPRLKQCENLYFLTITRPNVKGKELKGEITECNKIYTKIIQSRQYRKYIQDGHIGIVKSECTIRPRGEYHFHKHILIDSKSFAEFILKEWMRLNPTANRKGQDLKKVTSADDSFIEIFKYMTKLIAKDKEGKTYIDAKRLNVIFEAFSGKQVYKKIGTKDSWKLAPTDEEEQKVIEDELDEIDTSMFNDGEIFKFEERQNYWGYYSVQTGETLTEIEAVEDIAAVINGEE